MFLISQLNQILSYNYIFIGYGIFLAIMAGLVSFFWPWKKVHKDNRHVPQVEPEVSLAEADETQESYVSKLWNTLTWHYIFLCLFVPVVVVTGNFFWNTLLYQLHSITVVDSVVQNYAEIAGYTLSTVCLATVPFALMNGGFSFSLHIILIVALSVISSVLSFFPILYLHLARLVLFALYYPHVFGLLGSFINLHFGWEFFGVLLGFIAILSGILNFAVLAFQNVVIEMSAFFVTNIAICVVVALFLMYPVIVFTTRVKRRKPVLM